MTIEEITKMKFSYGAISWRRCKEIEKWDIYDPYGYGEKLLAHGNYFIHNKDESILFCEAFRPNHDDRDLGICYSEFILIIKQKFYRVVYDVTDVSKEERNGILYIKMTVDVLKDDFVGNGIDKKESLAILKKVITEKVEKRLLKRDGVKRIYGITFCYKGVQI